MATLKEIYDDIHSYIGHYFNLNWDKTADNEITDSITSGIEFKGTNIWVLIFAIFIASLGLNTNSVAVIIGAMLISPLMGPIMGVGLGLGTNDFDLIKRSLKNLAVATFISIMTSTLYFLISPLNEARSELLARTTPTIYDVLIAFFGGLAGIIATGSKQKGNVLPGVAIATALMPPLCTAGFGIATGNLHYFAGAFYLFLINSVMISLATTLGVHIFKLPKKQYIDKLRETKVAKIVSLIIVITIIPSVYITYNMVKEGIFENAAKNYIKKELNFQGTQVINKSYDYKSNPKRINVTIIGNHIPKDSIMIAKAKLAFYGLKDTRLMVSQGYNPAMNINQQKANATNDVTATFLTNIVNMENKKIIELKHKHDSLAYLLKQYTRLDSVGIRNNAEIKILFPYIKEIAISKTMLTEVDSMKNRGITMAYITFSKRPGKDEESKFKEWLAARLNISNIKFIISEK